MMLLEVTTNSGQLIGTLIDLVSDTNYITNNAAQCLGLRGENYQINSAWHRWDEKDGPYQEVLPACKNKDHQGYH